MKKKFRVFYFVSVLLLLLSGLSQAEEVMVDRVVAVVGDQIILLSDVQQKMRQEMINRKYNSNTSPQILHRLQTEILRGMIDDNLLHTKAERDSIIADPRDVDQFFNEHMTDLKQNLGSEENYQEALTELGMTEQQLRFMFRSMAEKRVIEQMLLQEIRRRISVTPQDMEAWYEANEDSLPVIEEQFKLSHIVMTPSVTEERKAGARKKLEGILERVRSGEDFAELAKQYSEDPGSASAGGDLDYFARGVMIKEFSDAAFALEKGEISDIVETAYGLHIIKKEDSRKTVDSNGNEVEEVNARHILLVLAPGAAEEREVINRLNEIREKILSGESTFEDMAKKYSEDEDSRELGGKLKWQTYETLVQVNKIPAFYTEAKKIKVGEISEPFKSSYGYHIITNDDYNPEHTISIVDDRSQIENVLYQEKTYRELERVLAELRAETYIDIRME